MRTALALTLGLLLSASAAPAQVERYELGQRLKRFEDAWEEQTDPAARKRALAVVEKASTQFLSFQFGEAARTLDEAYFTLRSADPPPDAERWLASLGAVPERRLLDSAARSVAVEVRPLYKVAGAPEGATAVLRVGEWKPATVPLDRLPARAAVPLPATAAGADFRVTLELRLNDRTVSTRGFTVSAIPDAADEIARIRNVAVNWEKDDAPSLETATLRDRHDLLAALADGQTLETDYPAAALLAEAGEASRTFAFKEGYYNQQRPGQFRFSVPLDRARTAPLRAFVPKGLDWKKPVPLVVALHGAGGSENLFFEGYGAGRIVQECEDRGWLLVAPRGGGLLGGTPPVARIVAQLAGRYPLDPKRVFLVGHSMGAAQAVELVQQNPGTFAAVACLGGGGRVRKPEAFAGLPVFVGVGSRDFAVRSARALHRSLTDAGAGRAAFKEYPDLEHLVIVREALPDAFEVFDRAVR
jgi:predicted esterase